MGSHSNFQFNPNSALVESIEFNSQSLYLHKMYGGDDATQLIIIDPKDHGFGVTAANNWAIKDGPGKDANTVAHAKGLHMNAIQWYNSFVIVFETERFKESTLLVMGATLPEVNDWGIVGGTGEFSMARGIIKRRVHESITGRGEIQELTIHGFCAKKSFPTPTKIEPAWGGNGGSAQDITAKPRCLESITIHSGFVIDSFAFSYIAQDGETRAAGPWGGSRGHIETIEFGPAESVKEISGTVGEIDSRTVISSLKFVTNLKTYGPFGRGQGKKFSYSVPENKSVVAFFGRSEKYLDAIGVRTA